MAEPYPERPLLEPGTTLVMRFRALGLRWLLPTRIVYVLDESEPNPRYGFAYGTLPGHVERGEACYSITWDRADDRVWYEVHAFVQPAKWYSWLGWRFVLAKQRPYLERSTESLLRAIQAETESMRALVA